MKIFSIYFFTFFTALWIVSNIQAEFTYTLPKYSYHKFQNGFEVILVENHTSPLIATVVVVKTGLRNETPENNGVSHMLEHMIFNGTQRRTQKQLYNELDYYGIYLNAQTSEDYTTYMALNHKDQVDHALDIISDMLFNSIFPENKFEKEKGIIIEEISKDGENPDFQSELRLRKAFYKNPPYSLPVIGTIETVRHMTRKMVVDYYHQFYSPNNMIAIIIGDFDQDKIKFQLQKYFGKVKARPLPPRKVVLTTTFPFFYTETKEKEQVIYLRLPAPIFYSNEFLNFQYFMDLILNEENGFLVNNLKNNKQLKIKKIQTNYEYHPEFAFITLKITTEPGVNENLVKNCTLNEFQKLQNYSLDKNEFKLIQQELAISEILQTEKILYYGFLKAQELTVGGKDAFEKTIPALLQTPADKVSTFIRNYYRYFNQPEILFKKVNWPGKISVEYFQKSVQRVQSGRGKIYRKVLDNGLTVLHLYSADNEVLAFHFLFKNRSAWEPAGKTGIADFLHHILFKSSKNFPEKKLQQTLKSIGAECKTHDWEFIPYDDYYNTPQYSYIRFVTLDQFFDTALAVIADNILHPQFDPYFKEIKSQMLSLAARKLQSASEIARVKFFQMLFGPEHPLAQPVSGTPESITSITLKDLKQFHQKYFSAGNTILTIVSSLDSQKVFSAIEKVLNKMPKTKQDVQIPEIPLTSGNEVDSLKIGSRQAYIYAGYAFNAHSEDYTALMVMNQILNNQIAFSLREQKGWAYRLGSKISSWKNRFFIYTYMGTGKSTIWPAIYGIKKEIEKFKKSQIDPELVERTKNSILAALVRRRASRENQAFFLGLNEFNHYPPEFFFEIYEQFKTIQPIDLIRVSEKYLQTNNYCLFYTIPAESTPGDSKIPRMPNSH